MQHKSLGLNNIDSEIVSVLNCIIACNEIKTYVEPDIVTSDIISSIQCANRYGLSKSKYIVGLYNYISNCGEIPDSLTVGEFEDAKAHYNVKDNHIKFDKYVDWYYGLLGYELARLARQKKLKPFCSRYITQESLNHDYSKLRAYLLDQSISLHTAEFKVGDISNVSNDLSNALIFCSIPENKRTDTGKFLEEAYRLSENNTVIIKTNAVYSEFELVWEEYIDNENSERLSTKLYEVRK